MKNEFNRMTLDEISNVVNQKHLDTVYRVFGLSNDGSHFKEDYFENLEDAANELNRVEPDYQLSLFLTEDYPARQFDDGGWEFRTKRILAKIHELTKDVKVESFL